MRKFLKKAISFTLAAAMAVSLTACGNSGDGQTAGTGEGSTGSTDGEVFMIGGIGPVTGSAASYGNSVKQGAQIAIDEINANGGINGTMFDMTFEDDQAKAELAINAYNKVMDNGANAILGTVTSDACIAITDLTNEDGILQVTPSGSAVECAQYDNAFRICFTDPLQGQTMANFVADELKVKNVALIYNVASDYSTGMCDAFVEEAKEKGLNVVAKESYTDDDKDFRTQLTKIDATNPDVVFVTGYYTEAAYILTQANQMGMTVPFLGGDGWDGVLGQLKDETDLAEGVIFLSPFFAEDDAPIVKTFVDKYQEAYNETPDQFAADGYDGVYAIAKAFEKAGSMKNEDLIAAMTEIQVDGTTGNFTFTAEGEPEKDAKFIQIKDGKYTIYGAE